MIYFNLRCYNNHQFDAWFRDGDSYEKQQKMGLVSCPHCGVCEVSEALNARKLHM